MPTVRLSLSVYRVSKCGYFAMGAPSPAFGDLSSMLEDLSGWTKGKWLVNTCPLPTDNREDEEHPTRTFCLDLTKGDQDEYLLTLWNEASTINAQLASVKLRSPVGSPEVELRGAPKGNAPGHATYFWIIPRHRLLVTLRQGGQSAERVRMEKYSRAFLRAFGRHVAYENDDETTLNILGYRPEPGANIHPKVWPRFNSASLPNPKVVELLRTHRSSIQRIIGRRELSVTTTIQQSLLRQLLELTGIEEPTTPATDVPVRFDLEYTPSEAELEAIIASTTDHDAEGGEYAGVAFYVGGGIDRIVDLQQARFKLKIDATLRKITQGILSSGELLKILDKQRATIVASLV